MSPRIVFRASVLPILVVGLSGLAGALEAQAGPGEPRVMSMEIQPVLRNVDDMARALDRLYPPLLKDAGIEGVVVVWIHVDELGRVRDTRLKETSGHVAFDEAALRVAQLMSFEAARNGSAAIPVWIPMGITFRSQAGTTPAPAPAPEPATTGPPHADPDGAPAVSRMTTRPTLSNGSEASAALLAHYPPVLRGAGIGGTVNVWFYIDENGVVQRAQVNQSSGYDELDDAALQVARVMRFTPARNDGEVVPVWVALNITFAVQ